MYMKKNRPTTNQNYATEDKDIAREISISKTTSSNLEK
jgi:hypothetical protein